MSRPGRSERYSWMRLGAEADRGTAQRRIGSLILVVASGLLTLAIAAMGILVGSYQERLERDYARVPVTYTGTGDVTSEGARWRIIADTADGRWVHVFVVVPESGTPLPPGLRSWPQPGHVVLSPALRGTSAGAEILERYGADSRQVIGQDGLVSPRERIAYVRPADDILQRVEGIPLTGYGAPYPARADQEGFFGGAAYQRTLAQALSGAGLAIVLPALVLMVVASRSGSALRDRRLQVLRVQGAGPREHFAFLWGAAGRALIAGGLGALAVLILLLLIDIPVPGPGAVILARDVRAEAPLVLVCAAVGWILAAGIFAVMNRPRRLRGTRPRPMPARERLWALVPLPLACLVMIQVLVATLSWEDASPRLLIGYAGLLLVALALPSFIGGAMSLAARFMTVIGRRSGSPALIVAGRQVLHDPRSVRRLGAGMAIMVVLIAHAMVLGTLTNSFTRHAQATQAAFGSSILEVSGQIDTHEQRSILAKVLGSSAGAVSIAMPGDVHDSEATTTVTAACPTLTALGLPCSAGRIHRTEVASAADPRLDYLAPSEWAQTLTITVADPLIAPDRTEEATTSIISYDASSLPVRALRAELAHSMLPPPAIFPVGDSWITGLQENRDQSRWNAVGAAALTVLLGLAITAAVLGDVTSHADWTGVLSVWGAGFGFILGTAVLRVLVPLLVALCTGSAVAYVTAYPYLMPPLDGQLPPGYFLATAVLPLIAAVVIALISTAIQSSALRRWRPGNA